METISARMAECHTTHVSQNAELIRCGHSLNDGLYMRGHWLRIMPHRLIFVRSASLSAVFLIRAGVLTFAHAFFPVLRARVPCLGYFPHPPSASNIASEILVCKGENKDVFITALYMEFNKTYYNFAHSPLVAA